MSIKYGGLNMGRITITKGEAERWIEECEKLEACGFKVMRVNLGDGKDYTKEALYQIRDRGGIVLDKPDETPPIDHIISLPRGIAYYREDDYTEAVKAVIREKRSA